MSPSRYTPEDALQLWYDPEWINRACNPYENPAYSQARQTTRCFGLLMVDELEQLGGVDGLAERVSALVRLPGKDFAAHVPAVEVRAIPKAKVPSDLDAGDDAIEPVTTGKGAERPIVVAPLLRKALSVHLSVILEATGDHLLPEEAIAYRPGHQHVVQKAILDAARAVRGGHCFWSKLDVRNFFPSVPWSGIAGSLRGYGYPEEFVDKTMALVMGKLEKRTAWRTWTPLQSASGTQAGLRESSAIANLFLAGLDRRLRGKFKEDLFYRRYSDDMLLMGKTKEVVRRAVVEVEQWIESHGLTLKGVSP